jgi:predicted flap endonuclease-1-like 5' DNA nuclease
MWAFLAVIGLILAVLVLAALISGLIFYIQFCNSPEKQWAKQVVALLGDARRKLRAERKALESLGEEKRVQADSITEKAFRRYLAKTSVDELQAYSGIGPGTVAKLREDGYHNLSQLRGATIRIHGLGEKRLSDIDVAVRDLVKQALNKFETGTSPEARENAQQIAELDEEYKQLDYMRRSCIEAAEAVLRQVEDLAEYARKVTYYEFVRPSSEEPAVPSEIQEAPLPDLDSIVQEAGQTARKRFSQQAKKASMQPPSKPVQVAQPPTTKPPGLHTVAVEIQEPALERSPTGRTEKRYSNPVAIPVAPPTASGQKPIAHDPQMRNNTDSDSHLGKVGTTQAPSKTDMPPHLRIMEATIQLAFLAARVDGSANPRANALIQEHMRKRYAYDVPLFNHAKGFCAHYETAAIDRDKCFRTIMELCAPDHRASLLEFIESIMTASGPLSSLTQRCLTAWRSYLGVPEPARPAASPVPPDAQKRLDPPANVQTAKDRRPPTEDPNKKRPESPRGREVGKPPPAPTEQEYRSILEIDPSHPLSTDLVRRQYRLLQERFAPEKVHAMGGDVIATVERKRAAVRAAAAALLEKMGEKLSDDPDQRQPQELRANPDLDDVFGV